MSRPYLFIIFILLFLVACRSKPMPTPAVAQSTALSCKTLNIFLESDTPIDKGVLPGTKIIFYVRSNVPEIQYEWPNPPRTLRVHENTRAALYTVPDTVFSETITVHAQGFPDCPVTSQVSILLPTVPAKTATTIHQASSTPTVTKTSEPTATTTPTKTITPSTTPTKTAVPTILPTNTATPTRAMVLIRLLEPKDNTCVGGQSTVKFQWESDYVPNDVEDVGGDYFALNIWSNQTEQRSVTWVKETFYLVDDLKDPIVVFTQEVDCTIEGGCFWNVDFIRAKVPKGQGYLPNSHEVVARSPIRNFCVVSGNIIEIPIPPTDTPQPPTPTRRAP